MTNPVNRVRTKLMGIPIGSSHFHAPSCHPTERMTEATATMTTVTGNHPVIKSMLRASVLMSSRCKVGLPKMVTDTVLNWD
jgi:hypothetical protein